MDALDVLAAEPGTLRLGGRCFVIAEPTAADMLRVAKRMRELARAQAPPRLAAVAALKDALPPDVFAAAVREAVALGPAAAPDPTDGEVREQFTELEGVRWQVWYFASKAAPDLTPGAVAEWVTADNRFAALDQLNAALGMGGEKKAPPPPTTTGS